MDDCCVGLVWMREFGPVWNAVALCQRAGEFEAFARWLASQRGAHATAIRINGYLAFFQEVDAEWGRIPNYKALVARFHAEGLRRVRLAVRWMDESHRLLVDEKVREEDSERQRINLLEAQIDATSEAGGMWNA